MKITENVIPLIEKALGFELYDWQKSYLLNEPVNIPKERAQSILPQPTIEEQLLAETQYQTAMLQMNMTGGV